MWVVRLLVLWLSSVILAAPVWAQQATRPGLPAPPPAPANTPLPEAPLAPQTVARLNTELRKGLQHPDMRSALDKVAAEPIGSSPQEARRFVQDEFTKWAAVVKAGNVRPE